MVVGMECLSSEVIHYFPESGLSVVSNWPSIIYSIQLCFELPLCDIMLQDTNTQIIKHILQYKQKKW